MGTLSCGLKAKAGRQCLVTHHERNGEAEAQAAAPASPPLEQESNWGSYHDSFRTGAHDVTGRVYKYPVIAVSSPLPLSIQKTPLLTRPHRPPFSAPVSLQVLPTSDRCIFGQSSPLVWQDQAVSPRTMQVGSSAFVTGNDGPETRKCQRWRKGKQQCPSCAPSRASGPAGLGHVGPPAQGTLRFVGCQSPALT